jgi:hypothetical protein
MVARLKRKMTFFIFAISFREGVVYTEDRLECLTRAGEAGDKKKEPPVSCKRMISRRVHIQFDDSGGVLFACKVSIPSGGMLWGLWRLRACKLCKQVRVICKQVFTWCWTLRAERPFPGAIRVSRGSVVRREVHQMRHLIAILILFTLSGCSAPAGPPVVELSEDGIRTYSLGKDPKLIPWDDVKGLTISGHLISEKEGSAPVMRVLTDESRMEICSNYPARKDPKSYGGMHVRMSVKSADFETIRDSIVKRVGLQESKAEGVWEPGGEPGDLKPGTFSKGIGS